MKEKIISVSKEHYYKLISKLIDEKNGGYVRFANVHMLIEAYDEKNFSKAIDGATLTFPDGFPVAKSFYHLYGLKYERIAGMDFLPEFIKTCNNKAYKALMPFNNIKSSNDFL